jgi:hypothetical protein
MFNKKNLVAIVTALSIGAGTFIATAPAHAASSMNFTTLENSVEAGVTEVGRKGKRHRRHHRRHGRRHHGHWGFPAVYFGGCFFKTFKKWDPYAGGWVFYKKRVCY